MAARFQANAVSEATNGFRSNFVGFTHTKIKQTLRCINIKKAEICWTIAENEKHFY